MKIRETLKKLMVKYKAFIIGLIFLFLFVFLDLAHFSIPNSPAILTTLLIYVAFQNGLMPALLFSILMWFFTAIHFSLPGTFFHYDRPDLIRVLIFAFMFPANALMVGLLKNKLMDKIRDEKTMREQVFLSSKLSSLGEMAGGIAHEINNPLAIISLRCLYLNRITKRDMLTNEQVLKNVKEINQNVIRMSKVVRGLKLFARDASQDDMEIASVNKIIDATLSFCKERFKNENIELIFSPVKSYGLLLECRPTELSQILLNLFNNAFDAVEKLDVKWIEIRAMEDCASIKISVTDSGMGISAEVRGRLMQPFFTTKEPGKGIGLGLSISLGIAKAHGGSLQFDEKCKNTCFVLALPKIKNYDI